MRFCTPTDAFLQHSGRIRCASWLAPFAPSSCSCGRVRRCAYAAPPLPECGWFTAGALVVCLVAVNGRRFCRPWQAHWLYPGSAATRLQQFSRCLPSPGIRLIEQLVLYLSSL